MRRIAPLTAALVLAIASVCAPAQESRLPDIGSSAGELLTPAQQEQYGAMMLAQLRQYDYLLEDPLVDRGRGLRRVDLAGKQRVGVRQHAVKDQHRQPRPRPCG